MTTPALIPEAFARRSMFDQINAQNTLPASDSVSSRANRQSALVDGLLRTAVVIPARNEQQSIGLVLGDLPSVGCVVVVNNGSTDATRAVAEKAGATVVDESTPGYGQACLTGLDTVERIATEIPIEYIAFVDGDYSDHAHLLPLLLEPLVEDEADFVLGSRMLGEREQGAMPPQATWGNRLACFLMRVIWGARYTDLGPFRVIRRQALRELEMQDVNFGWTVEMQVKATVANMRVREIPVPYRRRIGVSKISGTLSGTFRAGYKILYTIGKYAWTTRLASPRG